MFVSPSFPFLCGHSDQFMWPLALWPRVMSQSSVPQHSHTLEPEPSTLFICELETSLILVEDLWISAIRLKDVKELKVEGWKSKIARGWLALTVAKDRQENEQWAPGDLPGWTTEAQIQQGHTCNLDNESLVTSRWSYDILVSISAEMLCCLWLSGALVFS